MDEVASKAIRDLKIGDLSLGSDAVITEIEKFLVQKYKEQKE